MEEELPIEEVKEIEVLLCVKWFGADASVFVKMPNSNYTPDHDVMYRVRIPKAPFGTTSSN